MKTRLFSFALITLLVAACNVTQFFTRTSDRPITYWRLIWLDSGLPEADMIALTSQVVLDRVETQIRAGADPAENIRTALQLIIDTPEDRLWLTDGMTIDEVSVQESAAVVRLSGHINVIGGLVGLGTEVQLAMTVFEQPGIETALITFNGLNIANLVVDHESQLQPEDFVYTRADLYAAYLPNP